MTAVSVMVGTVAALKIKSNGRAGYLYQLKRDESFDEQHCALASSIPISLRFVSTQSKPITVVSFTMMSDERPQKNSLLLKLLISILSEMNCSFSIIFERTLMNSWDQHIMDNGAVGSES